MAADESEWLNRLLNAPGRGDFTNEEIDELFNRHASANAMPERAWPLSDARNRLSELIRRVRGGKAQLITVRGEPAAMLVPVEDERRRPPLSSKSLADVLLSAPRVLNNDEADRLFGRDAGNATGGPDDA